MESRIGAQTGLTIAFLVAMMATPAAAEGTCNPPKDISGCPAARPAFVGISDASPYTADLKQAFVGRAKELGLNAKVYDALDSAGQVALIEELINDKGKVIVLTPYDPVTLAPAVKKARDAGKLVISLAAPPSVKVGADANVFAAGDREAGLAVGKWAKGTLGAKAGSASVATLDLSSDQPAQDASRHNGFLEGFGVAVKSQKHYSDSDSPLIVGSAPTLGSADGGKKAMQDILAKSRRLDVVYAINGQAALGGYDALKAAGKAGEVTIVTMDGGCNAVKGVQDGKLGATFEVFPQQLGAAAAEAAAGYLKRDVKPADVVVGAKLVTDRPVAGVPSITTGEATKLCWQ